MGRSPWQIWKIDCPLQWPRASHSIIYYSSSIWGNGVIPSLTYNIHMSFDDSSIQCSAWTTFLLELEVPQFWDDVSHRFLMPPTAFVALDLNHDTG